MLSAMHRPGSSSSLVLPSLAHDSLWLAVFTRRSSTPGSSAHHRGVDSRSQQTNQSCRRPLHRSTRSHPGAAQKMATPTAIKKLQRSSSHGSTAGKHRRRPMALHCSLGGARQCSIAITAALHCNPRRGSTTCARFIAAPACFNAAPAELHCSPGKAQRPRMTLHCSLRQHSIAARRTSLQHHERSAPRRTPL